MSVPTLDLIVILVYLVGIMAIGILSVRKMKLTGEVFIDENGEFLIRDGIDDFTMIAIDVDGNGELDSLADLSNADVGTIGGVSFELLENEWKVSSVGIESNDTLVAATIQELIFGEVFETTYDPPLRNQLKVGRAVFVPREFARVGHHLVIGLDLPAIEPEPAPDAVARAPRQTDSLRE